MRASRHWDERRTMLPSEIEARFGEKFLPCPFCGCPTVGLHVGPSPHCTCANCGADGPVFDGSRDDIEERQHGAIKAWNGATPRMRDLPNIRVI